MPELDPNTIAAEVINKNIEHVGRILLGRAKNVADAARLRFGTPFHAYLRSVLTRYSTVKTLLHSHAPAPLYSLYVPLSVKSGKRLSAAVGIVSLESLNRNCLITGTGGCGKSTLMRHLFIDSIRHTRRIPIFVELRSLNDSKLTVETALCDMLTRHGFALEAPAFGRAMASGLFAIFLDGLDEALHETRNTIRDQIDQLTTTYPKNMYIISSRPSDEFLSWSAFSEFQVCPLAKEQAIELISRLPYEGDVKTSFIDALQSGLFEQQQSFASNPLLLTIMLLTYSSNAEVPAKRHLFYAQAFDALWNRHDATKGVFKRQRFTSLAMDDFIRVLSSVCAQSYMQHELEFSKSELISLIARARTLLCLKFDDEDYLNDLTTSVCIIVQDGLVFGFAHRSFQEYYTAVYFERASSKMRQKVWGELLARYDQDSVLPLLFEINQERVEEECLIPYLERIFNEIGIGTKIDDDTLLQFFNAYVEHISIQDNGHVIGLGANMDVLSLLQFVFSRYSREYPQLIMDNADATRLRRRANKPRPVQIAANKFSVRKAAVLRVATAFGLRQQIAVACAAYKAMKLRRKSRLDAMDDLL